MHSFELIGGLKLSYVCTLPYDQLDARSIKYLYETSVENLEDIIRSIDCANKKIEVDNEVKLKANAYLVAENKLGQ